MPAAPFVKALFGWNSDNPNIADAGSATSREIAGALFDHMGVTDQVRHVGQTAGAALEDKVHSYLTAELPGLFPNRIVSVTRGQLIQDFDQFQHLARLKDIIDADATGTLRSEIATDYQIKPDVTVGLRVNADETPMLHAAIPCKWTLRSDRAQNIRHEAVILIRHRRGRLPHIVSVTAEPMPTRLASLARGTGEIDAVYHACLDELAHVCESVGTAEQREILTEMVEQDRLKDLTSLPATLSI